MSDFAFRMSSKDRKLAMGEKISPADVDYDPEGEEYPDPLEFPEAFVQKLFQDINSARRNEEFEPEDIDNFESNMTDFLVTCSDSELGPEDLPGTAIILDLINTDDGKNGISTFGGFGGGENAAATFGPQLVDAATSLIPGFGAAKAGFKLLSPFIGKGLKAMGLSSALSNVPIIGGLFGGDDGGGDQSQPIQTMVTESPGYVGTTANNRFEMPFDHIADNLMFESASGIRKKDTDIETLRAQVNAALKEWAKSGTVADRATWWALYSYSHEADTVAELMAILTATPEEYHNSVLETPVGLEENAPEEGNTGLPIPAEPENALSPAGTSMSPIPIDGIGTPPKMPEGPGQPLIPGAMASHDKLKIKPIFSSVNEEIFNDYVKEDRPILAKVAAFVNSGTHESDIIDTLYPSYGHEYTIWALEEVKKKASGNPLYDNSVAGLGIEWKQSAEKDPHDLPEGMHQMNIMEVLEDVEKEKKEKKNKKFPEKGERVGPNEDEKINQQETSGMMTPQQEKTADYYMNPSLQHDEDATQINPMLYLSRKLSYAYSELLFLLERLRFEEMLTKAQEVTEFVETYIENYMDTAWDNTIASLPELNDYDPEVIENIKEGGKRTIQALHDTNVERIVFLTEKLATEFQNFSQDERNQILQNPQIAPQMLHNAGIDPREFAEITAEMMMGLDEIIRMLIDPISGTPGFDQEALNKLDKNIRETGEFVNPLFIVEQPEDLTLNETDRRFLNEIGADFPQERNANLKKSDYTSLPSSNLATPPSPYSSEYGQTMGISGQLDNPILAQQMYQTGTDVGISKTPDPGVFGQLQQQKQEDEKLQQMYPNVPPDMARQWMQRQNLQQQSQGHPIKAPQQETAAGQVATNAAQGLPSATTAKVSAWKDIYGDMLMKDKLYKMTSSEYPVPDYVRVLNNGSKLEIYIPRGGIDVTLDEREIKESNYKFEPISEKESSFLSESTLTTYEQRSLIDEQGIARNIDRLNLEGTHYPALVQTSNNDKIDLEEIPLNDFFIEDLDLFI